MQELVQPPAQLLHLWRWLILQHGAGDALRVLDQAVQKAQYLPFHPGRWAAAAQLPKLLLGWALFAGRCPLLPPYLHTVIALHDNLVHELAEQLPIEGVQEVRPSLQGFNQLLSLLDRLILLGLQEPFLLQLCGAELFRQLVLAGYKNVRGDKAVFPSFFAQFLRLIEYLLRNHCFIDSCHKIHGPLSTVALHFAGYSIRRVSLPQKGIAAVPLIGEDVVDPLWLPRAVIREQIQRRCDVLRRLACQVGVIDIPDNRRLLRDQLQFSAHKLVSKRGEAGIVFPLRCQ